MSVLLSPLVITCDVTTSSPDSHLGNFRGETFSQLYSIRKKAKWRLLHTHHDRQGRMVYDARLRPRRTFPCPGCGKIFGPKDPKKRSLVGISARYCALCNGLKVKPTFGNPHQPTTLIPTQPRRRSARILANYQRQPDLDFTPIMQ